MASTLTVEAQLEPIQVRLGRAELKTHTQQCALRRGVDSVVIKLLDSRFRDAFQAHWTPDAGRNDTRRDIPSPDVRRLAQIQAFLAAFPAHHSGVIIILAGLVERRSQAHYQPVLLVGEDLVAHLEALFNQHILRAANLLTIEPDSRQHIQPFENQRPARIFRCLRSLKRARIPPLVRFQRAQAADITTQERFGEHTCLHQVQLNISWHLGGENRLAQLLPVFRCQQGRRQALPGPPMLTFRKMN